MTDLRLVDLDELQKTTDEKTTALVKAVQFPYAVGYKDGTEWLLLTLKTKEKKSISREAVEQALESVVASDLSDGRFDGIVDKMMELFL